MRLSFTEDISSVVLSCNSFTHSVLDFCFHSVVFWNRKSSGFVGVRPWNTSLGVHPIAGAKVVL